MKSRLSTYILFVAAFAVWGLVAWKIIFPRHTSPDTITPKVVAQKTEQSDGYRLLLDYEDPFLKGVDAPKPLEDTGTSPSTNRTHSRESEIFQEPPPMKYAGTISAGGKTLFLVEHGGTLSSLSVGETIEGYTLTDASPDSVRFTKSGMAFTINRIDG